MKAECLKNDLQAIKKLPTRGKWGLVLFSIGFFMAISISVAPLWILLIMVISLCVGAKLLESVDKKDREQWLHDEQKSTD